MQITVNLRGKGPVNIEADSVDMPPDSKWIRFIQDDIVILEIDSYTVASIITEESKI